MGPFRLECLGEAGEGMCWVCFTSSPSGDEGDVKSEDTDLEPMMKRRRVWS